MSSGRAGRIARAGACGAATARSDRDIDIGASRSGRYRRGRRATAVRLAFAVMAVVMMAAARACLLQLGERLLGAVDVVVLQRLADGVERLGERAVGIVRSAAAQRLVELRQCLLGAGDVAGVDRI